MTKQQLGEVLMAEFQILRESRIEDPMQQASSRRSAALYNLRLPKVARSLVLVWQSQAAKQGWLLVGEHLVRDRRRKKSQTFSCPRSCFAEFSF